MISCSLTKSICVIRSVYSHQARWQGLIVSCFSTQPIVELRECQLYPGHAATYLQNTAEASNLRKSHLPLRFFSLPETGGQLWVATHAYHYVGGHAERDKKIDILTSNEDWKAYLLLSHPCIKRQSSTIWTEAPLIREISKESPSVHGLASLPDPNDVQGNDCILEIRRYKLKLGYDTVPRFLDLYASGLHSKLEALGTDPTTSLISVIYNEVGRLNEVIELWRHGNGKPAMEASRQAARNAPAWRKAIAGIADQVALEFTTTIHKPTSFSPIR